jgi:hypothetical protein
MLAKCKRERKEGQDENVEQIVYQKDRTKVSTEPEVIWIFNDLLSGKTNFINNYLQSKYENVKKVGKY